jgi:hypothetical protein
LKARKKEGRDMKLGRTIFSFAVALAAAIILFTYDGFAQEPGPEKGASGPGVAGDANRLAVMKESIINPRESVQPVRKTTSASAASAIGFLPADIFASTIEPKRIETRYPASVREPAASKGVGQGNDDDLAALAKKLRNPVSSLASLSFQNNLDYLLAADREGWRYTMNFEPVVPIPLNKDWNLISRTILPFIQQDGVVGSTVQTGLGDILQSVFLSPSKTEPLFWGVGTALLIPTATDTRLGAGKFGLGPTLVAGKQQGGWTYGAQARQIWSVAGHRDRADVRSTYIQPFVAYTTKSAWTYSLNTESTYDWVGKQWSVPIHFEVTKVVRAGRQPVLFGGAFRCWAATFPGGPQACGVRFIVTPLFPAR